VLVLIDELRCRSRFLGIYFPGIRIYNLYFGVAVMTAGQVLLIYDLLYISNVRIHGTKVKKL
jgi:hypothetical protein